MNTTEQLMEQINIENDPRTRAARRSRAYTDTGRPAPRNGMIIQLDDDVLASLVDEGHVEEGHDGCFEVGVSWSVCDLCGGEGKCVNPEIDAGGLSARDLEEEADFHEAYYSGHYNIECPACRGKRVVPDIAQDITRPWLLEAIRAYDDAQADYEAMAAAERRWGA